MLGMSERSVFVVLFILTTFIFIGLAFEAITDILPVYNHH